MYKKKIIILSPSCLCWRLDNFLLVQSFVLLFIHSVTKYLLDTYRMLKV